MVAIITKPSEWVKSQGGDPMQAVLDFLDRYMNFRPIYECFRCKKRTDYVERIGLVDNPGGEKEICTDCCIAWRRDEWTLEALLETTN